MPAGAGVGSSWPLPWAGAAAAVGAILLAGAVALGVGPAAPGGWLRPAALALAVLAASGAIGWAGWTLWRTAWGTHEVAATVAGGDHVPPLGAPHRRGTLGRAGLPRRPGALHRARRRARGPHRGPGPHHRPPGRRPGPAGAPGRLGARRPARGLGRPGPPPRAEPGPGLVAPRRGRRRPGRTAPRRARHRRRRDHLPLPGLHRTLRAQGPGKRRLGAGAARNRGPPRHPLRPPGQGGAGRRRGGRSEVAAGGRTLGEGRPGARRDLPGRGAGQLPVPVHRG